SQLKAARETNSATELLAEDSAQRKQDRDCQGNARMNHRGGEILTLSLVRRSNLHVLEDTSSVGALICKFVCAVRGCVSNLWEKSNGDPKQYQDCSRQKHCRRRSFVTLFRLSLLFDARGFVAWRRLSPSKKNSEGDP